MFASRCLAARRISAFPHKIENNYRICTKLSIASMRFGLRQSRQFSDGRHRMLESLTPKEFMDKLNRADLLVAEKGLNDWIRYLLMLRTFCGLFTNLFRRIWCSRNELGKAMEFFEELKVHFCKLCYFNHFANH